MGGLFRDLVTVHKSTGDQTRGYFLSGLPAEDTMKILITGSRNWNNRKRMFDVLDFTLEWCRQQGHTLEIIHGAARGADELSGLWAERHNVPVTEVPANWDKYGRSAGYKRNTEMAEMKPDIVLAFPHPDSVGTNHMINIAREKGLTVHITKGHAE